MRILYLGNDAPYCTERYVSHALIQEGHQVALRNVRAGLSYRESIDEVRGLAPHFVLFSKPSQPWFADFLSYCSRKSLLTVCWQWDLYWGYRPSRPIQFNADLLFTTDGGSAALWAQHYPRHEVLRQGIHKPESIVYPSNGYDYDVAFIGTVNRTHPGRRRMVKHLAATYSRFKLVEHGLRGLELNRFLARVKVVVGDSYPKDHYWSNRIYEMTGRGACLVYPRTVGLDDEFTEGVHYAAFNRGDFDGLDCVISSLLSDRDMREDFRTAGHSLTSSQFTYQHRVRHLLSRIRCSRPDLP